MSKITPATLTDTQRQLLVDAAQRPDGAVVLPERRARGAANAARALLTKALVREIRTKADGPVWRQDGGTGRHFSLVLTKAGRSVAAEATETEAATAQDNTHNGATLPSGSATAATLDSVELAVSPPSRTKIAGVIDLLRRDTGSSVAELMAVTGWLPHTTRAAMTGLRKRGYAVIREAGDTGSVYRIAEASEAIATTAAAA